MKSFYIGVDAPLLWGPALPDDPNTLLMVSHGRLRRYKTFRPARFDWVCDSRGFTELSQFGRWTFGPEEYARWLLRYDREIGRLRWASPQDLMCEDEILALTGLTVPVHQQLTVQSVVDLRRLLAGRVHVIPVLQGRFVEDYVRCDEMYLAAGIDLRSEPVVGLGSICRRQRTSEIREIVTALAARGIKLHGFGVKTDVHEYGSDLHSADSTAWSFGARKRLGFCPDGIVVWERNCPLQALVWRDNVLRKIAKPAGVAS